MENKIFEIPISTFLTIVEASKKIKSYYTICETNPNGLIMYGIGEGNSYIKYLNDYTGKVGELGGSLPFSFVIESKYLAEIERLIRDNPIPIYMQVREAMGFYFAKKIICGNNSYDLYNFETFCAINYRIMNELSMSIPIFQENLMENKDFQNIISMKSGEGAGIIRVGEFMFFITPGVLNMQKDDEAYVEIRTGKTGNLAIVTVIKKKKKCDIRLVMRVLDIRKQL